MSALELGQWLHQGAVIEVIVAEVAPGDFQIQFVVNWHAGRKTLLTALRRPRTFKNLNTVVTHLKTLGVGKTLVRLELLT